MDDHPSRDEMSALLREGLPAKREREVIAHVLRCRTCLDQAPPPLGILLGYEPAQSAPPDEAGYEQAIDKVFAHVREVEKHLLRERKQAKRALEILRQGGFEAGARLPIKMGFLARMEAFLARSWEVRYENTDLMIQFAALALQCAERLDARVYGVERVLDFRCRCQAEMGNALRVADKLDAARIALGRARELFEQGTGDTPLEIRLLDLEASLDVDLRRFGPARMKLTKIYRYHRRFRDGHLAGRALLQMGICHGYAGDSNEAQRLLRRSMGLIDERRDPGLAYVALHGLIWFLLDCGLYSEAEKRLFTLRSKQAAAGGRVNLLRQQWMEGRIDAGLGRLRRAELALGEVRESFMAVNRAYDSALASLDLTAVLLERGRSGEAAEVALAALKTFAGLGIAREALLAVWELRLAFELREATRAMVEETAAFLRRFENDPEARFEAKAWERGIK